MKEMDRGLVNGMVFLDISKAFDSVNHKILLKKLSFFGVEDNSIEWFKSYLANRSQLVSIGDHKSEQRID